MKGKCAIGLLSKIGKCAVVCCFLRTFQVTFFELYALTSTLVLGINCFVIITRPLHPIPVRKRSSSS